MAALRVNFGTTAYDWDSNTSRYAPVQFNAGIETAGIPLGVDYSGVIFGSDLIISVCAGKVVRGYTVRAEYSGGWAYRPSGVGSNPTWMRNGSASVVALRGILRSAAGIVFSLPPTGASASNTATEVERSYPIGRVPQPAGGLAGASKDAVLQAWNGGSGSFSTSPRVGGSALNDYMVANPGWKNSWTCPRLSVDVTLLLSDMPRRTHAASIEIRGSDQDVPVALAYPDGEPVVGVPVTLRASNSNVVVNGEDSYSFYASEATSVTDSTGVASFSVRGQKAGSATLAVVLKDDWAAYSDLYQPAFGTAPISATVTAPWQQQAKPPLVSPTLSCVFYPEQQAVEERSAYVTYQDSAGWNAGANSVDQLGGDVELVFTQLPATGVVIGFTQDRDNPGDRGRITHGFYFHRNLAGSPVAQVIESGVTKSDELPHTSSIEWRVQRAGGVVRYLADGEVVCQSLIPSDGELSVGCALYASTDAVES